MDELGKKFKFLEHPADVKIRVFGKNVSELFINAAEGMIFFLYGEDEVKGKTKDRIEIMVEAESLESLLVNWLSEILWLSDTKHCKVFDLKVAKLTNNTMHATASLLQAIPKEDIKAVTYHDLKIIEKSKRWVAEVVFDI